MLFSATVHVTLRPGISDPQGSTIERSLPALGFDGVSDVRVGKLLTFQIEAADETSARKQVDDMCSRFLSNPVIEDSAVTVVEGVGVA